MSVSGVVSDGGAFCRKSFCGALSLPGHRIIRCRPWDVDKGAVDGRDVGHKVVALLTARAKAKLDHQFSNVCVLHGRAEAGIGI